MGLHKIIPPAITIAKSVKAYRAKQLRRAKAQKRAALRKLKEGKMK